MVKMALGLEVGLGPGYTVLDWDPAVLPKKRAEPLPILGPFLFWPNGWMHATRYGGRLQPRRVYVRWGPKPSTKRGRSPFPILRVEVENFEIGPEVWGTSGYSYLCSPCTADNFGENQK